MKQSWLILISLLRTSLSASGLEGGIRFQSIEIDGKTFLRRYLPAPSAYNACACSVARSCSDPTWSDAQFLCYYGDNCTKGSVMWNVPGLIKSCTSFDSTLGSDLRCFFDRTCLNTLLSMYNLDMPKRQPLPPATLNINILNASTLMSVQPTDTLEKISSGLMIDDWKMRTNYVGYYNSCAPGRCTYTVTRRLNILYAFTLITTYFGGLAITLRLLLPICVRLVYWIFKRRQNKHSNINDQRSKTSLCDCSQWYRVSKANLKRAIKIMNLFRKESALSQMDNAELVAIKATRFYMILLSISVVIVAVFGSIDQKTVSEILPFPSLEMYEQLQVKYPNTLSCTCQQISILYKTFVSVTPKIHQVCSSDFIKAPWTTSLYGYNDSINTYQRLDRPLLSKHLQILSWLCDESHKIMDFWMFIFENRLVVDSATYTRSVLESFANSSVDVIRTQAPAHFRIIIPFITEMLQGNLLPTVFNTDWTIEYGNESNGYLTRSIPRLYMNGTCNCVTSNFCHDYLRIGPADLVLPGLVVGCSPIEGLRLSTLECFYSPGCISNIINHLEYYIQMNGSPPTNFHPPANPFIALRPLNHSADSHFLPNTSIGTLISEMFIEDWIKQTSYEAYFNACAPSVCRYQYTKQLDVLYVITSLLAIYGGLTVGWRFITWKTLVLYEWLKRWKRTRRERVRPLFIAK